MGYLQQFAGWCLWRNRNQIKYFGRPGLKCFNRKEERPSRNHQRSRINGRNQHLENQVLQSTKITTLNKFLKMSFNHGSLFSGIGGFDLAAEWMGWNNVFHCEWNLFGQKVLKYYWPNSISYGDITKTDFTIHRGNIDILTGGFPCQPYSSAGKRLGKADERHLWPEMLRAIREIQPSWIVGENVPGIVNWNRGMVFDEVQIELEIEGYEVIPFLLPACGINAPHRRERVWFIAYSKQGRRTSTKQNIFKENGNMGKLLMPNSLCNGENIKSKRQGFKTEWELDIKTAICRKDDGLPDWMDRVAALGNAIVPQVAFQIFKAIYIFSTKNQ